MRNKALNATLEQWSTALINGTEITLGAFFVVQNSPEKHTLSLSGPTAETIRNFLVDWFWIEQLKKMSRKI